MKQYNVFNLHVLPTYKQNTSSKPHSSGRAPNTLDATPYPGHELTPHADRGCYNPTNVTTIAFVIISKTID